MDINSPTGVLERQPHTTKPALSLHGQRFSLTGQLQKVGRNGSTRLTLKNFGVTIGDGRKEVEVFPPLPTGFAEIDVVDEVISSNRPGSMIQASGVISELELALLQPNTCLLLKGKTSGKTALAIFKKKAGMLRFVPKPPRENKGTQIHPRNFKQALAYHGLLMDGSVKLVALPGVAGTGKTLMALRAGLETIGRFRSLDAPLGRLDSLIEQSSRESGGASEVAEQPTRIVVCRSAHSVGKELGFLPGDLGEKIEPLGGAVYDALEVLVGSKETDELFTSKAVEVITPSYVRGRTLPRTFFIVDDVQNMGRDEVLTLLTRAGPATKVVLTGDPMQVDNNDIPDGQDGMTLVVKRFLGWGGFGTITLDECLRSELAAEAARRL